MKVRVNKPLLLSGKTIPAGTVVDLPTETVQLLGNRVELAGNARGNPRKPTTKVPAESETDGDADESDGQGDADDSESGQESDDDENENPKE